MDPPDFEKALSELLSDGLSPEMLSEALNAVEAFSQGEETRRDESQSDDGGFSIDPEMIFKLMSLFEKLQSSRNDPRCNLIRALKPLLSPSRQKKAETAIELLKIFSLFSEGDLFSM